MSLRKTSTMIFRITIKMVIIAAIVAVFYVVCSKTFEYGSRIFSEEAMADFGEGLDVVVTIPKDTTVSELGNILKENGLIEDAGIFEVQALLYELIITPGTYEFNTEHNVEDIVEIINANAPKEDEDEDEKKTTKPKETQSDSEDKE